MFHPVGSQPPTVYWRRRAVFAATLVVVLVLLALAIGAVTGGGSSARPAAAARSTATHRPAPTHAAAAATPTVVAPPTPTPSRTGPSEFAAGAAATPASGGVPARAAALHGSVGTATTGAGAAAMTAATGSSGTATISSGPAPRCEPSQLQVAATTAQSSYRVGDQPVLSMRVTNTGAAPCVQDLADKQVEFRIYNGESRVWGSHDCTTEPGVTDRTLLPGQPVLVSVGWSGLSSQPGCAGVRQRAGAGSYTLYASLAGREGAAAQFTLR